MYQFRFIRKPSEERQNSPTERSSQSGTREKEPGGRRKPSHSGPGRPPVYLPGEIRPEQKEADPDLVNLNATDQEFLTNSLKRQDSGTRIEGFPPPRKQTECDSAANLHEEQVTSDTARRKHYSLFSEATLQALDKVEEILTSNIRAPFLCSKLMIVGAERTGKTSTIKRLLGGGFNKREPSTRGCNLDLSDWSLSSASKPRAQGAESRDHLFLHIQAAMKRKAKKSLSKQASFKSSAESEVVPIKLEQDEIINYGERIMEFDRTSVSEQIRFTIWDFGGQGVFYSMHHLFMTENGCYVLTFNAQSFLKGGNSELFEAEHLRFWLNSKRLHAPKAPLLLVGTHCRRISRESLNSISEFIEIRILKGTDYGEGRFESKDKSYGKDFSLCFFPVDNAVNQGINVLRKTIKELVWNTSYLHEHVKISFSRTFKILSSLELKCIKAEQAKKFLQKYGLRATEFDTVMRFLNRRGLITYFNLNSLYNFIVIDPQWLIDQLTLIIFDMKHHPRPKFSKSLSAHYRTYVSSGIISDKLMSDIWAHSGTSKDVQMFLKNVMELTLLLTVYKSTEERSYLIPSFPRIKSAAFTDGFSKEYTGPYFVIDFSGDYDGAKNVIRSIPFGFFERLVCALVRHSSYFDESMDPQLKNNVVRLSLGTEVSFELSCTNNRTEEGLWILVRTFAGTSFHEARNLIKQVFSIVQGIRADFFSNEENIQASLSCTLLIPASGSKKFELASYEKVILKRKATRNKKFRPLRSSPTLLSPKDFDHWFRKNDESEEDITENNLINPQVLNRSQHHEAKYRKNFKNCPGGNKYHCFLSYKQQDSHDVVGKIYLQLQSLGYRCWYDQHYSGADGLNQSAMLGGVQESMTYILVLSRNVFQSTVVRQEIETALEKRKKVLLLSHPDTNTIGYVSFTHYIDTAPPHLKRIFHKEESLPIRRRYYEEIAFLNELDRRLEGYRLKYSQSI
eukprot:snap_masked-scaffold_36-processed-gene-0.42-mRNA-1 protein AED:0.19 eAED:0.25 QI:0/-1/0/1/-1/1/1/0/961